MTYFPLFSALTNAVNPVLEQALEKSPVVVTADPSEMLLPVQPDGHSELHQLVRCRQVLPGSQFGLNYSNVSAPAGTVASIKIGDKVITSFDKGKAGPTAAAQEKAFNDAATAGIRAAGYPASADPAKVNTPVVILDPDHPRALCDDGLRPDRGHAGPALPDPHPLLGHVAAVSYRQRVVWRPSLPADLFAIVAATGNILTAVWYPVVIAAATFVIGLFFMPETKDRDIYKDD